MYVGTYVCRYVCMYVCTSLIMYVIMYRDGHFLLPDPWVDSLFGRVDSLFGLV